VEFINYQTVKCFYGWARKTTLGEKMVDEIGLELLKQFLADDLSGRLQRCEVTKTRSVCH